MAENSSPNDVIVTEKGYREEEIQSKPFLDSLSKPNEASKPT